MTNLGIGMLGIMITAVATMMLFTILSMSMTVAAIHQTHNGISANGQHGQNANGQDSTSGTGTNGGIGGAGSAGGTGTNGGVNVCC
jgi:hypothetical protein